MSAWRVLIVEDDANGRVITRKLLEYQLMQVDTAENAEEALTLLEYNNYEAAIIDLSLPGMSGWQLREKIHPGIPCIAITAFHSPQVAQEAISAGFAAFMPKPLNLNALVNQLQTLFDAGSQ